MWGVCRSTGRGLRLLYERGLRLLYEWGTEWGLRLYGWGLEQGLRLLYGWGTGEGSGWILGGRRTGRG